MQITLDRQIDQTHAGTKATDLLAQESGLSRQRIKDAMSKGAVWLKRGRNRKRLRKATELLRAGDQIQLYYDADLLARNADTPKCLHDAGGYSVWFKPAGVLAQGNDFGDHLSLLRIAELSLEPKRATFPVHRLDRETAGLMLIAHKAGVAAKLSSMFQERQIDKRYRALVLGQLAESGSIDTRLDGKPALTRYRAIAYDQTHNQSLADIEIETGRTHQIRRHLSAIGHPVIGDPRYGEGNKNAEGLQLFATALAFTCPIRHQAVSFELSEAFLRENCRYTFVSAG
ncbi:RluA family pseudouridine synthase [Marinobacterium sp. D7]|uniref:RluA family pseudouridine synthase n=1 Tax=Marinobacterium ramblicola TaxID=2849041 RepID=UPI001C2CEF1A|nr:RluA family pseudouridine synthase [Marinobacterium ramblicola]MBV1790036.1 RluA family pseudouridine synthase [Marinobacterium ramblicola]